MQYMWYDNGYNVYTIVHICRMFTYMYNVFRVL